MSILSEQTERFGKSCKWLECDCWCHCTKCVLNSAKRDRFLDRLHDLGVKYPEVYTEAFSSTCKFGDYGCFDSSTRPREDWDNFDDEVNLTELEKEAYKLADELLSDDDFVMQLYREAKINYIIRKRKEMRQIEDEINDMEKNHE